MPIPEIDYDLLIVDVLPSTKRMPYWKIWIFNALSQIKRLHSIFKSYILGTQSLNWDSTVPYDYDTEIIYKYKVYKSSISNNLNNQPNINLDKWELVLNSHIGVNESGRYNYSKLTLEKALNRQFQHELNINSLVGFRQPDDPINPTNSDIYITNQTLLYHSFLVGVTEDESDYIGTLVSSGFVTLDEELTNETPYVFIVNIPSSVYSAINSNYTIADTIIRNFLDQYVITGTQYIIQTY